MRRRLPKGIQNFEEMRKGDYLYVDKTDVAWQIANNDKYNFLSRPRRFGKSLLVSTLHCYFEGRRELFEGLKIMNVETEWKHRQVFRFDFSGINTSDELEHYLKSVLGEYEKIYGSDDTNVNYTDRMMALMKGAYERTGEQVAVLIDEYDTPLQHTLFNGKEHESVRNVYRSLFPVFKTGSSYLKCLFITGITKFTQLSLFSTLNNLTILSSLPQYASVCGITEEEMRTIFLPELDAVAKQNKWTRNETMARMKDQYDGYHFSEDLIDIYNPFSVVNALSTGRIINYWMSSGGSSMLNEMLQRADIDNMQLDGCVMTQNMLETSDVSADNVPLFLYQTGYLTIKAYSNGIYTLGFPNKEVRSALYEMVLPNAVKKKTSEVDSSIGRIKLALDAKDIHTAMDHLQQLVSETPFSKDKSEKIYESRFRFILKQIFYLCGCRIEEEKQMAKGIIDLVVHYDTCILVMELKLECNGGLNAAVSQLRNREYASAFSAESRDVYCIAISFDCEKRGIIAYDIQKVCLSAE